MGFTLSIINPPSGSRYWWCDYMYGACYPDYWLGINTTWNCPYGAYGATDLRIYIADANYEIIYTKYSLGPIYDDKAYVFDCSTGRLSEEVPITYHLGVYVPTWAYGGYIEPGSGDYPAYSIVTLEAIPLSGYQFIGWGGDASGTSLTYDLYMDSDKYVEAYFERVPVPEYTGTITVRQLEYNGVRVPFPVE